MERRNKAFKDLTPDHKQPSLDEYYQKFKSSLNRIWTNKLLWFWGMFLPGSIGIGFNINEQISKLSPKEAISWQMFFGNNLWTVFFVLTIIFFLGVLIWCVSAISRSGVIQALDCLQKAKNRKKIDCRFVWSEGRKDFKKILLLDFFAGMIILLAFLILFIPVAIMILVENQAGAIFLFITLLFFLFFFIVFVSYLLQVAIIHVVLAKMEFFGALAVASRLLLKNPLEILKLFSIFFLIGVLQGTVFLLMLMVVTPFEGKVFSVWLAVYANSFVSGTLFIFSVVFLGVIVFLFVKAIFSLWTQDIWIWWVKEIGGNKNDFEEKEIALKKQAAVVGAVVRKKAN